MCLLHAEIQVDVHRRLELKTYSTSQCFVTISLIKLHCCVSQVQYKCERTIQHFTQIKSSVFLMFLCSAVLWSLTNTEIWQKFKNVYPVNKYNPVLFISSVEDILHAFSLLFIFLSGFFCPSSSCPLSYYILKSFYLFLTELSITLYLFVSFNISHHRQPFSPSPPSFDRVGDCVGRHVAMWGSRLVPQERGILIWAICNDRPTMSAEEWQVERLWQVLIAVRKSSWRMCQLHTLPFPLP